MNVEEIVKIIRETATQIIETYDLMQKHVVFYDRKGTVGHEVTLGGHWARGEHDVTFIEQVYPQILEFLKTVQFDPEVLGQIIGVEEFLSDLTPLERSPKDLYHYVRWYSAGLAYHWNGPYCPNLLTGQKALMYLAGYGLLVEIWRQLEEEVLSREKNRKE